MNFSSRWSTKIFTYEVLDDLFKCADSKNEYQRHKRCVATCRRHIRYLLEESDEEEKAVRVASKLLEQKRWNET